MLSAHPSPNELQMSFLQMRGEQMGSASIHNFNDHLASLKNETPLVEMCLRRPTHDAFLYRRPSVNTFWIRRFQRHHYLRADAGLYTERVACARVNCAIRYFGK
ncbi:hypothetical protein JTE90_012240 [Oedothorax gibbosus]|uniref:Uncharacterized protein n=1 Tax=Oedothorax gibbosus TaxID=931172 RepID=A0AAV6UYL3_9ARAC|nr:hypothetical protein JTE90_012240 [Oedothorax gibbosus]